MHCDEFDTAALPAHAQFDAWRGWYGQVFDTALLESRNRGFVARNRTWNLGGVALSHVSAPGLSVVRTKTLIRREPVDHWVITLSERRATHVGGENGSLEAPAHCEQQIARFLPAALILQKFDLRKINRVQDAAG